MSIKDIIAWRETENGFGFIMKEFSQEDKSNGIFELFIYRRDNSKRYGNIISYSSDNILEKKDAIINMLENSLKLNADALDCVFMDFKQFCKIKNDNANPLIKTWRETLIEQINKK